MQAAAMRVKMARYLVGKRTPLDSTPLGQIWRWRDSRGQGDCPTRAYGHPHVEVQADLRCTGRANLTGPRGGGWVYSRRWPGSQNGDIVVAMLRSVRYVMVAAAFAAVMYGDDITLRLDDGSILIRAQFIRVNYGSYVPELAFSLKNQTSSSWRILKLHFDIGGLCNGEQRQWTIPVVTSLGWAEDHQLVKKYTDYVIPLVGKVDGCRTEIIKASLLLAENSKTRIDGVTGERIDLEKELQELKAKREAEAAAQAEEEQKAFEAQVRKDAPEAAAQARKDAAEAAARARKDAAEAARRKRLAAERKQKQKEADARYTEMKVEEDAKAAEERRKLRAACTVIYQNTVDKKVKDLTVREEQQVREFQALGLYPPQ